MHIQSVLKRVFIVTMGVCCMNQGIALAANQEPVKNVVLVHGALAEGDLFLHQAAKGQEFTDLTAFEACVKAARRLIA